jgi:hypothetical protein
LEAEAELLVCTRGVVDGVVVAIVAAIVAAIVVAIVVAVVLYTAIGITVTIGIVAAFALLIPRSAAAVCLVIAGIISVSGVVGML